MGSSKISSNDVQRLFLQAIMSRRFLSEKLARTLWQKCINAVNVAGDLDIDIQDNRQEWDAFIHKVNRSLDPLDLEIRHAIEEATGVKYYALTNTKDDEVAQMATDYSPVEIAYFKAVVEQIVLSANLSFSLSSLAALREVTLLKPPMTKTQGEVVLGSFVAKGWLAKSKKGRYSLTTRTILELQPYLRSAFPEEILECTICMELVTKGITCPKPNCHTYLHNHCYAGYRKSTTLCPTCKEDWTGGAVVPIGEAAAKAGQDDRRKTRRRSSANDSDEDEDMDASQDPSQSLEPSQNQSQSQGKRGKAKAPAKKTNARKERQKDSESEEADDDEEEPSQDMENAMDIDNLTQGETHERRSRRKR